MRERLPGGIIVARALDPTLPDAERDYAVDIYPEGSIGAQTLVVHAPGDAATALTIARTKPWVRALLYPRTPPMQQQPADAADTTGAAQPT
jgi:hypothetical protein